MSELVPMPGSQRTYESEVVGFVKECLNEGDAFLKSQKGYTHIQESMDAIFGDQMELRTDKLSSTTANHIGKIALDLASGMTDVRPFMEYETRNPEFQRQVDIFKGCGEYWWFRRSADMALCDTVKFAEAAGTGYCHMIWDSDWQDIRAFAEDPRDVIPIRPTSNLTIQDAAGVIIRRQRTVNYGRRRWPKDKWPAIKAEKDASVLQTLRNTRFGKLLERATAGLSPFHDVLFGNKAQDQLPRIPTYDEYTVYLDDTRTHEGTTPLFMGEFSADGQPLNNWSYRVYKGQPIYPNKRLIILTNHGVLYDGPSQYWHGLYPTPKLTLDPWPWCWLGKGVLWDLLPLQKSLDRWMRVWDDWLEKLARPDVIADKNSVSKAALDKIDTRRAGLKFMQNPLAGKGIQIVPPPPLPQDFWRGGEFLIDQMNTLSGVVNVQALMRLNQMPSSDTIEQVAEKMSPSVRLRSRIIECFIREFATMLAYNFCQFYTVSQRLRILGPRGVTTQDFDFDPKTLVPDYLGADLDTSGNILPSLLESGPRDRMLRAKELMQNINFFITPGSLLAQSDIMEQMKYVQLYRMMAVDLWTMLDRLKVPNIGPEPPGTIIERLVSNIQQGIVPQVSSVGRKATAQEPPKLKSSGAISESG